MDNFQIIDRLRKDFYIFCSEKILNKFPEMKGEVEIIIKLDLKDLITYFISSPPIEELVKSFEDRYKIKKSQFSENEYDVFVKYLSAFKELSRL